jgi:DUF1680 family protein
MVFRAIPRRDFLQSASIICLANLLPSLSALAGKQKANLQMPLKVRRLAEFDYRDIEFSNCRLEEQFQSTINTILAMSNDEMLKPYRVRAGLSSFGRGFGGWYDEDPSYDPKCGGNSDGFAPGHCFGQWLSALARAYAINRSPVIHQKIGQLLDGYEKSISSAFFEHYRFPAYTYDKLVCGLLDAYKLAGYPKALSALELTTDIVLPYLPERAIDRGEQWPDHPELDESYRLDESYTLPENLFRAFELGAGDRYLILAKRYLADKTLFIPLANKVNQLTGKHAYSYMNALCSAMWAYFSVGSQNHLQAARNGFEIVRAQSFATGGWGPNERFIAPGSGRLGESLKSSHHSFEICGAYAHMKLTRYLLCATGESIYGDSMEQVIYNTVLGAKPLQSNGRAFYYCDYNFNGKKEYYWMNCPCCAGTLPQIVVDYRICTYFHDDQGVSVNLYVPSTLIWRQDGAHFSLTQTTEYPLAGKIYLDLKGAHPRKFNLRLRIPDWAGAGASVSINDIRIKQTLSPGSFLSLDRTWLDGDRICLELPLKLRLTGVDAEHPDMVALSYGPLVLFALHKNAGVLRISRASLLGAQRSILRNDEWLVYNGEAVISLRPFISIENEQYSTYWCLDDA